MGKIKVNEAKKTGQGLKAFRTPLLNARKNNIPTKLKIGTVMRIQVKM
jgi:hypothetical protein